MKELVKNHVDTIIILSGMLISILLVNEKFADIGNRLNDIEKHLTEQIYAMDKNLTEQITLIDKRVSIIETVMILEGKMPKAYQELSSSKDLADIYEEEEEAEDDCEVIVEALAYEDIHLPDNAICGEMQ